MIELEGNQRVLYQWDQNKRIVIDGFPAGTIVEFSLKYDCKDSALLVKTYAEGEHVYADIPNSLLQHHGYIRAFVRPSANAVDHEPAIKDIKVTRREKPEDYSYIETPTLSYEELAKRVEALEKNGGTGNGAAGTGTIKSINGMKPDENGNLELVMGIGRDVSGKVQTPYDPNEAGNFEYIYEDPVEALPGAEILNDYDNNIAVGYMSQASGYQTQAIGNYSKAEGWWTRADGQCAVASGLLSRASGHFTHAEGTRTLASINNAHSEGDMTQATGRQSHSEGQSTISSGFCSHAEGSGTVSSGYYSHAEGLGTTAKGKNQTAMGKYNIPDTTSLLIVGKGSANNQSNAFTVSSSGTGWFSGSVTSLGADYAEFFEWADGNSDGEDRVGLAVTLEGDKIRIANAQDDILGFITGTAMVLGDNAEYEWKYKYQMDDYGRILYEDPVEEFAEYMDYEQGVVVRESIGFCVHPKLSPEYNPDEEYVSREKRKEWDPVGLIGKLRVNDDGSCKPGMYAKVADGGILTHSEEKTNMRVMRRISDHVVLVILKGNKGEQGPAGADGKPGKDGADGKDGAPGADGKDYVLTEADKQEIAELAAEMVDVPGGGGGGEWRKVAEIKTTEDLTYLSVTEDMDGNPFAFDEMIVLVGAARASDATTNGTLVISPCAEWRSSFNSHGVYGFPLNADVYAYPVAFRVLTDGLLRMDVSSAHRIANNLSQYVGYASNAEKGKVYYQSGFGYSGFTITPSKGLTDANSYLDENGRLRSVTIGTDTATSIKIGAGSTLEVWGR